MKKSILLLSLAIILMGGMLTNCQSQATKEEKAIDQVQDAKSDLEEAKSNLTKVQQDSVTAYQEFIKDSEDQIKVYEKNLAELKEKIAQEKKGAKATYEKKLAELEQKNKNLKTTIVDYKNAQADNWNEKQLEFKRDLDELGSAIAGFFEKD